jgi:hypothetical protein
LVIPIQIKPAPEALARVMVGRVEVLTPERERQIERWVADLASEEASAQAVAKKGLSRLGRFQESVLRRIASLSSGGEVADRARSIVEKGGLLQSTK